MRAVLKNKPQGFTLAEVLITLAIIGVVAAITIPSMLNNSAKKDAYSKLLKAYSNIVNISNTIRSENGGAMANLAGTGPEWVNLFMPYFKVIKYCQNQTDSPNCYLENTDDVYNLQGGILGGLSPYYFYAEPKIVAADGMMYNFELLSSSCSGVNYTRNGVNENCGGVMIDTNGAKPPNTEGKDIFHISINKYNTTVETSAGCDKSNTGSWNGVGCAKKAIQEGGIYYY